FGGLQIGESMRFTGASAAEILVGTPTAPGEFVYIPFHASRAQGNLQIEARAENIQTASLASPPPAPSAFTLDPARYPSDRLHAEFYSRQRRSLEAMRHRIQPSLSRAWI